MKRLRFHIILIFLLLLIQSVNATHNRAGEITYRLISGYTFEITITTFTYSLSTANRNSLIIEWGDNSSLEVALTNRETLPDNYYHNTYVARHTYPGPGTYQLLVQDPNRNDGVVNIPNSVNTVFSIKSSLSINPLLGANNTPILSNPPIDKAAVGIIFIHNPGAYDLDGDSLVYKLTSCSEEGGDPIKSYTLPEASKSISIDEKTGDFIWDAPVEEGNYNVALLIEEWRKGILIGSVVRDMQITVVSTDNKPPVNPIFRDWCVIAGDTISFDFTVTDPDQDNDSISVIAIGAPFDTNLIDVAKLSILSRTNVTTTARFRWETSCKHVNNKSWTVIVKSKDSHATGLVDIDNFNIHVVAPSPILTTAESLNNTVYLTWQSYSCANASGFYVYRLQDNAGLEVDTCIGGIGVNNGFELIGKTNLSTLQYTDNSDLMPGAEYCYRIVAYFSDGAHSLPSNQLCVRLKPGLPAIIKVSVTESDIEGNIFLAWLKPRVDTIPGVTGPYTYKIYRSDFDLEGKSAQLIGSFQTSNLNDTTYHDSLLNTLLFPYSYRIEMYDGANNLIGEKREIAASFYPSIRADNQKLSLSMKKNTPWSNTQYVVYRSIDNSDVYDSIGITNNISYIDSGLINGKTYCYKIQSIGYRNIDGHDYPTLNDSHILCGIPIDTTPPCQPPLTVNAKCDSFYLRLNWRLIDCAFDAVYYNIYYAPTLTASPNLIQRIYNPLQTEYIYAPAFEDSLKGCFFITATDSFDNESPIIERVCTDKCFEYALPNYFSPNGDGYNEWFGPIHNAFVKKVEMLIYNRWGLLVFQTNDPEINWDGRYYKTKELLPTGTYFYICTVYEDRLSGENVRTLPGFIYMESEPVPDQKTLKE